MPKHGTAKEISLKFVIFMHNLQKKMTFCRKKVWKYPKNTYLCIRDKFEQFKIRKYKRLKVKGYG